MWNMEEAFLRREREGEGDVELNDAFSSVNLFDLSARAQ